MSPKFSGKTPTYPPSVRAQRAATTPVTTVGPGVTHEGGAGYVRDPQSELFLLAVTNMVGEDTFYESAELRDERFRNLLRYVATSEPEWLSKFIPWLRDTANMRTASVVAAAEYIASKAPGGRQVVAKTLLRPDEPGEILGYWLTTHGRTIPSSLKRGIGDALERLYTEVNTLKYDGQSKGVRFGDVVDLVHPKPSSSARSALYKHLIDRRHGHDEVIPEELKVLDADRFLIQMPEAARREALRQPGVLAKAGWTWERLSGWLPGGMDAEAWESVIPEMGYMALLRNLRNFDEANISTEMRSGIITKLTDPGEVAKSRQFPFRFMSAWTAAPSLHWGSALETALDLSVSNIPQLPGRTLILVDVSGSMSATISAKSTVARSTVGALFGAATFKRSGGNAKLVAFGTDSMEVPLSSSTSVLRATEGFSDLGNRVGHGTNGYQALAKHYTGENRVVFFTDCQMYPATGNVYGSTHLSAADQVPLLYTFNLGGYRTAAFEAGKPGRHELGGFSDATFKLMDAVERYESSGWNALFG